MFVERFVKTGRYILFNSRWVQGNDGYLIKVSDYMTLFPIISVSSGEDP